MSDGVNNGACHAKYIALRKLSVRSGFLFANFFLIIMALYQLKPSSRSFFIDTLGADMLPYVWIGTALTMMLAIKQYNKLVERFSRFRVVLGSCIVIIGLLGLFRMLLAEPEPFSAAAFYIFVDILGVVLVEQFWCLTNSIFTTDEGKTWYGFIGSGGLVGGIVSGAFGAWLLKETALVSADLLVVAIVILSMILGLTWLMGTYGVYCEADNPAAHSHAAGDLRSLLKSRYLVLLGAMLLLGQVASQFIEFQFLKTVEHSFVERDARTAFLSQFFSILSVVAIAINLLLTPLIHRLFGAIAGLVVQPALMAASSLYFFASPTLMVSAAMKISDRGLSYSINRASRELLYVPVSPVVIYQAKAWIDMFGYRMFKVFGSFVILLFTQWLPIQLGAPALSWFTVATCAGWAVMIMVIRREYLAYVRP